MLDKAAAEGPLKVTRGDLYAWSKGIESLQAELDRLSQMFGDMKTMDSYLTNWEKRKEAEAEVERLRAGIWEMVGILGFDQDGAEHHHLTHPDIVAYGVERATEMRKDYDEANDDFNAHYKGSGTTT